ncbi:MAG: C/D box methylation guide ribonucleoprotein complex aNOP56 subunit [Promethearchaeota archaeon]
MDGFLIFGIGKVYCLDEHFSIISEADLGETVDEIILVFHRIRRGVADSLLAEFFGTLDEKAVNRIYVESQVVAEDFSRLYNVKALQYEDIRLWRKLRQDFLDSAIPSKDEKRLHEIALGVSRIAVREAAGQNDQLIIQAMNTLDDVEKVQNLMVSRLREWYGLHFPEAANAIENGQTLARIVTEGGSRRDIEENPNLLKLLTDSSVKAELLEQSIGAEILESDMVMVQSLARQILDLYTFREQLERYLDESMHVLAPNLRALIGPVIGARLIGLAGGIEKLARYPASTIQVLGAEQALFRALKTGAKPPKHGAIFQHTLVHSAPWWQRGKIARILAGKIAIAARIDFYSGQYVADELKQTVLSRVAEVKRKYPTAPKRPPSKPQKRPTKRKHFRKKSKSHAPKKRRTDTERKSS